jgi:hypothetical protein
VGTIAQYTRKKLARPAYEEGDKNKIQKPGRFDNGILRLIQGLTIITAIFAVMGWIAGEMEMGIAFSVLTLVFGGVILLLKREYNMSYQENEEYFIYKHKNKEYTVYYENIVDWLPGYNEIQILDETNKDRKYIKVNVAMLKPEILLQKLLEMTYEGKFMTPNPVDPNDSKREDELAVFLNQYNYGYLVEGLKAD